MYENNIEIRNLNINRIENRQAIDSFLQRHDLILEKDVDFTLAIFEDETIIGTGSLSGNVLKCIAIDPNYQGEGLANKIISMLITEQFQRGNTHLFIFTKPKNKDVFIDMGFMEIASVENKVSLLENDPKGLDKYLEKLKIDKHKGTLISSIIMNCNPFTFGHQYLIEEASRNSDIVHIFVVWEDRSIFPNEVRYKLVQQGTQHLQNVYIHKGEDYIISNSTFPSYFIKEKNSVVKTHAMLDLKIFGEFIAPALDINRRYVGEEPNDPVTNEYNRMMQELLPKYNIEFVEIPRLLSEGSFISASKVREAIRVDKIEILKQMVPLTTYNYLMSKDAEPIIKKIKNQN